MILYRYRFVFVAEPYLLIMEYVMYGKLLAFLRDRRTRSHYFNFSDSTASLTSRDLTMFAYCVARGMDFLVSKKVRNFLFCAYVKLKLFHLFNQGTLLISVYPNKFFICCNKKRV